MRIHTNDRAVGSLSSADSNSHSFYSPNWHWGSRRRSSQETIGAGDDTVVIETHTALGSLNNSATANLGNAISLSQTQDAFLQKVQESLQRMSELSVLAQGESKSDSDRSTYATEFAQLQDRLKDLGTKMFQAANLFQSPLPSLSTAHLVSRSGPGLIPSVANHPLTACLENTYDPGMTGINSAKSASEAIATIDNALNTVKDMRIAMGTTIQRLSEAGEQLCALSDHLSGSKRKIKDTQVAEQSTRFARYDILVQSGTAMLAQANALPQSALRLLD